MNLKNYEISVWNDEIAIKEFNFKYGTKNTSCSIDHIDEKKRCIIGSNLQEDVKYAHEPKWITNVNGTHTLTFYMFYKYYNKETGKLEENPYIQFLSNEQKIKLKLENEWFDLVIKKVEESSDKKTCTYTCKDLYINELSKNGYELEFSTELENNQGTALELADRVLEGIDWSIDETNSEIPIQYIEEPLYRARIAKTSSFKAYRMSPNPDKNNPNSDDSKNYITLKGLSDSSSGTQQYIYIFYSSYINQEKRLQFIYDGKYNNSSKGYPKDDNNIILTEDNLYLNIDHYDDNGYPVLPGDTTTFIDVKEDKIQLSTEYRGKRIVRSPKSAYDNKIGRAVNIYSKKGVSGTIYGYVDSEAITTETVKNLIVNNRNFSSTNGWKSAIKATQTKKAGKISVGWSTATKKSYLGWSELGTNDWGLLYNSGWTTNRKYIHNVQLGEEYVFEFLVNIAALESNNNGGYKDPVEGYFRAYVSYYDSTDDGYKMTGSIANDTTRKKILFNFSDFKVTSGNDSKGADYCLVFKDKTQGYGLSDTENGNFRVIRSIASCSKTLSYKDLLNSNIGIFISTTKDGDDFPPIYAVRMYKKVTTKKTVDNKTFDYIITPDIVPDATVKTIHNFYLKSKSASISSEDELTYLYQGNDQNEIDKFILQYDDTYAQVHGITVKESNRFNILQDICESFNVWARFNISHETNGKIQSKWYLLPTKDKIRIKGKQYFIPKATAEKLNVNLNATITQNHKIYNQYGNIISNSVYSIFTGDEKEDSNISKYYELRKISKKKVVFKEYIGIENPFGFRYGVNLSTINRSIDSEAIVSKIIVKDNVNEHAKDGYCSISRANSNIIKENFIYDFRYYINQGILNREKVYQSLYGNNGIYTRLSKVNEGKNELIEQYANLSILITQLEADVQTYSAAYDSASDELDEAKANFKAANNGKSYTKASDYVDDKGKATDLMVKYGVPIEIYTEKKDIYKKSLKNAEDQLSLKKSDFANVVNKLTKMKNGVTALTTNFFNEYSRFIQEGTWTDETYMDDDLYYYEATNVLATSAMPKVSYTFKVIDISRLSGFEKYKVNVGDKTFVQDPEFFGYKDDGITPYKEEVIVSEITEYLRQPEKTEVKIQNYKTQFEDLFQRIAAATQTLEFHEGEYAKTSNYFTPEGTISERALQSTMDRANWVLSHAKDQSVVWDKNGITVTSASDAQNQLRIVNRGIIISNDGGETWNTAITGKGINATYISTGHLDADKIHIKNGEDTAFAWTWRGITAYNKVNDTIKGMVRFNKYGIFGISGDNEINFGTVDQVISNTIFSLTWKGLVINKYNSTENKYNKVFYADNNGNLNITGIITAQSGGRIANWYIDSDKLSYSNGDTTHFLRPTTDSDKAAIKWSNNFIVYGNGKLKCLSADIQGKITANEGSIGGWKIETDRLTYSIGKTDSAKRIISFIPSNIGTSNKVIVIRKGLTKNNNYYYPFYVTGEGKVYMNEGTIAGINVSGNGISYSGTSSNDGFGLWRSNAHTNTDRKIPIIFHAGGNGNNIGGAKFRIYQDGYVYMNSGHITGNVTIDGKLTAGQITVESLEASKIVGQINGTQIANGAITADKISANSIKASKLNLTNETLSGWTFGTDDLYYAKNLGYTGESLISLSGKNIGTDNHIIRIFGTRKNLFSISGKGDMIATRLTVNNYNSSDTISNKMYIFTDTSNSNGITIKSNMDNSSNLRTIEINSTGIKCYGSTTNNFEIKMGATKNNSMKGILLNSNGGSLSGTWYINSSQVTSDIRLKENIKKIPKDYDLFFDNLKPVFFNYIEEPGVRSGFIAQEIKVGLSNIKQDVLSLVSKDQEGYYGLSYNDFISLNTWQIQKLKKRVSDLENKIQQLETLVK